MTKIIVRSKFCKLENIDDKDFLRKLDNHLSFVWAGYEHLPAYRKLHWDGKERLLSKSLTYYTGLLEYVKDFFIANNKEFEVIDERPPFVLGEEIDISGPMKEMGIIPFDYQISAVEEALKYERMILKLPTGSGKSIVAAMITAKIGKPTVIYVISKELLHQFHSLFSSLFSEEIGIIGDGICIIKNITIASVWTVGKAIGMKSNEILSEDDIGSEEKYDESNKDKILNFIRTVKIHNYDEAHMCASKTIRNIYNETNPEKLYSFSGTPYRSDGADLILTGILGSNMVEISASSLIKRGILAKPYIKFIYCKGQASFTDNYNTVYSNHVVNNDYRNNIIVSEAKKLLEKNYQVIILFKTIKHGKILKNLFDDANIEYEYLSGKDTTEHRKEVKDNLLAYKSNCVIASKVFDIGVDIKTLSALILANPTKSRILVYQKLGRLLRNGKEKPHVAVIDFYDDIIYLKAQAKIRKALYELEPEFVIKMPKEYKGK